MKEIISILISILGGSMVGISLDKILNSEKNIKRNIAIAIIGLIICVGNIILFSKNL